MYGTAQISNRLMVLPTLSSLLLNRPSHYIRGHLKDLIGVKTERLNEDSDSS